MRWQESSADGCAVPGALARAGGVEGVPSGLLRGDACFHAVLPDPHDCGT